MQYTENYNLYKPVYGEPADVADLNHNADEIDSLIHDNRTMIAPSYDSAETYAVGDIVERLGKLYRCIAETTGTWDATKWTLTTLADECEGGGGGAADVTKTVTGATLEITDAAAAPFVGLTSAVEGTQSGSGTPSPEHVRPITGCTQTAVTVADASSSPSTSTTYTATFVDTAEIFEATADLVNKRLTITKNIIALGSANWTKYQDGGATYFYTYIPKMLKLSTEGYICTHYAPKSGSDLADCEIGITIGSGGATTDTITIRDDSQAETSASAFKTYLSSGSAKLAYTCSSAVTGTLSLSAYPVKALSGSNYITSTTGDLSAEYITQDYQPLVNPEDMVGATGGRPGAHGLVPAPTNGDGSKFLKGDGTWAVPASGATALTGLSDVAVSSPTNGQILKYNTTSSKWANTDDTSAAQLNAMKTGFDGVVYPSPAAMVQGCDQKLQDEIDDSNKEIDFVLDRSDTPLSVKKIKGYDNVTGTTYDATTRTITISSGSQGNNSKIYDRFTDVMLEPFKGKKVVFIVDYVYSSNIANRISLLWATNTGITLSEDNVISKDGRFIVIIDFPSDLPSTSGKYINIGIFKSSGPAVTETSTYSLVSDRIEYFSESEYIDTLLQPINSYQTKAIPCFVNYDSIIVSPQNGASISENVITIPVGSTGQNTEYSPRILPSVNILRGRKFRCVIQFSSSDTSFKLDCNIKRNGTGTTFTYKSVDLENGVAVVEGEMSSVSTSTYVYFEFKVTNYTAVSGGAVTITVTDVSTYILYDNTQRIVTTYNPVHGLLMSCMGHSMVQQDRWQKLVCQELNLSNYANTAIYGGVLMQHYEDVSNIDTSSGVVVIWYDTNDWVNNITLGTAADDAEEPTTYCGALKYVCEWISTNIPKAKVVLVASPKRFTDSFVNKNELGYEINNNGDTLEDFGKKIKEIADLYSFSFCDLFHKCGCNKNNKSTYLDNDNLHPSYYGAYRMGLLIADAIRYTQ